MHHSSKGKKRAKVIEETIEVAIPLRLLSNSSATTPLRLSQHLNVRFLNPSVLIAASFVVGIMLCSLRNGVPLLCPMAASSRPTPSITMASIKKDCLTLRLIHQERSLRDLYDCCRLRVGPLLSGLERRLRGNLFCWTTNKKELRHSHLFPRCRIHLLLFWRA